MLQPQESSNQEKKVDLKSQEVDAKSQEVKAPVINKEASDEVADKLVEEAKKEIISDPVKLESISNTEGFTNSWGRQDEFVELNSTGSINSGLLTRNSGQEIGGLGVILKSERIENGVHSESLLFVPGASIVDLYEDYENPGEISGRTLAKR